MPCQTRDVGGKRWLLGLVALPPFAAVVATNLAAEPHGHWVEHLSSAALKAAVVVIVGYLTVVLRRRLPVALLVVVIGGLVGTALQSYGDWLVADSIWRTTIDPGPPGNHDLTTTSDVVVLVFGLLFAVVAGMTRSVRPRLAVLAAVMVIIPPPFMWPLAGVLMVLLHAQLTGSSLPARNETDVTRDPTSTRLAGSPSE